MARYTYTPGGRLATIESGNGIITRYTYDGEGNLSGLSVQKGEAWLLYAAAFTYDLRGNRLTKRGQRLGGRRKAGKDPLPLCLDRGSRGSLPGN